MRFKMEPFDTGLKDGDGDPVEVWIAAAETIEAGPRTNAKPLSKNEKTMFAILHRAGAQGLMMEEWNERARAQDIGIKRKADLWDIRNTLKDKNLVREYGGRWSINHGGDA